MLQQAVARLPRPRIQQRAAVEQIHGTEQQAGQRKQTRVAQHQMFLFHVFLPCNRIAVPVYQPCVQKYMSRPQKSPIPGGRAEGYDRMAYKTSSSASIPTLQAVNQTR